MGVSDWTEDVLEQIEGGNSQAKKQHSPQQKTTSIANAVISQVTGKGSADDAGSHEAAQVSAQVQQAQVQQANTDMVRDMYAPSEAQNSHSQSSVQAKLKTQNSDGDEGKEMSEGQPRLDRGQKVASEFIKDKVEDGMSPEEAQKLYSLRKQLHNEYYQKLINYSKNQPDERTAEKVEKEKEEDARMNLEERQKKDAPIAVQMGANRTEKFPGASG